MLSPVSLSVLLQRKAAIDDSLPFLHADIRLDDLVARVSFERLQTTVGSPVSLFLPYDLTFLAIVREYFSVEEEEDSLAEVEQLNSLSTSSMSQSALVRCRCIVPRV